MKILIVAHPYVVYDEYLCGNIIHYFKDEDIDILYSDRLNRKIAISYAEDFSNTLYFLYSKENIGSSFYYKDCVDGIVFLSSFPCASDFVLESILLDGRRFLSSAPCYIAVWLSYTAFSAIFAVFSHISGTSKTGSDNILLVSKCIPPLG